MNVNTATLRTLAKEINRNPLWGMLHAREYFEPAHPLFIALATKANRRLNELSYPEAALRCADRIISGERMVLNTELRSTLRPVQVANKRSEFQLLKSQHNKRSQKRRSGRSLTFKVTGQTTYRGIRYTSRRFSSTFQGHL